MLYRFYARSRAFFMGLLAVLAVVSALPVAAQDDFLDPDVAFVMSAAQVGPDELHIHYTIAPAYYMYRTRFDVATQPAADTVRDVLYPPGLVKFDETFNEDLEVYYRQVTLRVMLKPGNGPQTLAVTSQGCADAGLCYPPITKTLQLTQVDGGYQVSGTGVVKSVPEPLANVIDPGKSSTSAVSTPADSAASMGAVEAGPETRSGLTSALAGNDAGLASYLVNADPFTVIGLSLLLGVLLTFTPCVLPMVPIVLAVIAGSQQAGGKPGRWRGLSLAATYLLGVSILYTAMGIVAGLAGASLAAWLQTPWVLAVFAALLSLLALAMFNVYTFQAPSGLQSALSQRLAAIPGGHYGGAFVMGLLSALIIGPCVAAPLAGVLLFISQTGDWVLGGAALFALAWGQGVLLLVLGAGSGAMLPKAGPWMEGIRQGFGLMLLATAWWMLNPVLPAAIMVVGWSVLALWSAVLLGLLQAGPAGVWSALRKAVGLMLTVWAVLMLAGMASGTYSVLQPLRGFMASSTTMNATGAAASASAVMSDDIKSRFVSVASVQELDQLLANTNRPVLLDFYADWCVSCIEMEKFTFTDPAVARLMQQFVLVQADVTKNTDDDRALLRRFNLFGPPGILFFTASGDYINSERVVGFMNAADFATVLERVQAAGKAE